MYVFNATVGPSGSAWKATLEFTGTDAIVYNDERMCVDKDKAVYYVRKSAVDLLQLHLEKYINHKNILSQQDNYRRQDYLAPLTRCLDFKKWLYNGHNHSMEEIARNTVKMRSYLEKILPNPNNPSYATSKVQAEFIQRLANWILENLNPNQQPTQ